MNIYDEFYYEKYDLILKLDADIVFEKCLDRGMLTLCSFNIFLASEILSNVSNWC